MGGLPLLVAALIVLRGCGTLTHTRPRRGAEGVRVLELELGDRVGMSGLALDDRGRLWTIPEQGDALLRIQGRRLAAVIPVQGIPGGLEAEALAWLEGERFAIGTEASDAALDRHRIFIVEASGGVARVTDELVLDGRRMGVRSGANEGVEGLCSADGFLLASLEATAKRGGVRYAAVALRSWSGSDMGEGWRSYRMALPSRTGKISALDCHREGNRLIVHAVERHYQVMHLVRFVLPVGSPGDGGRILQPELVRNLAQDVRGAPNFEGLAIDGNVALLVVDNHYGHVTGPNELVRIEIDP